MPREATLATLAAPSGHRAFTPLSASATLAIAGAGLLGLSLTAGAPVHWAVQGLLWLVAGAAAGISLSGSA